MENKLWTKRIGWIGIYFCVLSLMVTLLTIIFPTPLPPGAGVEGASLSVYALEIGLSGFGLLAFISLLRGVKWAYNLSIAWWLIVAFQHCSFYVSLLRMVISPEISINFSDIAWTLPTAVFLLWLYFLVIWHLHCNRSSNKENTETGLAFNILIFTTIFLLLVSLQHIITIDSVNYGLSLSFKQRATISLDAPIITLSNFLGWKIWHIIQLFMSIIVLLLLISRQLRDKWQTLPFVGKLLTNWFAVLICLVLPGLIFDSIEDYSKIAYNTLILGNLLLVYILLYWLYGETIKKQLIIA